MCDYCENGKVFYPDVCDDGFDIEFVIEACTDGTHKLFGNVDFMSIEYEMQKDINYCMMCGKKLGE